MGKVIRVTQGGKWCLVQWSIDGSVTRVPAWSQRPVDSSNGLPEDQTHLTYLYCHLSYLQFTLPFFCTPLSALQSRIFLFFGAKTPFNAQNETHSLSRITPHCSWHVNHLVFKDGWQYFGPDVLWCVRVFSPAFSLISWQGECCPSWFGVLPASSVPAKRGVTSFLVFCK